MRLWLAVTLFAAPAFAGQLMVERYGLADVKKEGIAVIAGTVVAFAKGQKKNDFSLTVKVTRVFGATEPAVGSTYTCTVYEGVVWDDPHKSPLDRRLNNAVGPMVAKGKLVYLVPQFKGTKSVELLQGTPENLTRLEVHFDEQAKKRWLASADQVLEAALGDDELAPLAFPELAKRGSIRAAPLLKADQQRAKEYLKQLAPPARAKFFKDALELAKTNAEARDDLYALACNDLSSAWTTDVAPIAALYQPAPGDAGRRFTDLRDELGYLIDRVKEKTEKQKPDLSAFGPYLVRYLLARPDYRSSDDSLPELFPYLSSAAKQQMAVGLITGLLTSNRSKPDDPDLYVLDVAEQLTRQAPSVSVLEALGTIDPSLVRVTSQREATMGLMLDIGRAVVKGVPSASRQAQVVLEPWLVEGVEAEEEALKAWRKTMPKWKPGPAVAATFELTPGQQRRTSTGARVRFTKDATDYGFTWAEGDTAISTGLGPTEDWYRELHLKPWLVTVERVGQEVKLKVKATPAPAKLEPLGDPAAHDVLEAQSAKDGCPQWEAANYDESNGTFTYEASGDKGKKCSYVYGLFSRTFHKKTIQ